MKNLDENILSTYLEYSDANNLYGWPMCKKLPVSNFTWVEDFLIFTESFIKNYDESNDTRYILEVEVEYPENLFYLKEWKLINVVSLSVQCTIKKTMLSI